MKGIWFLACMWTVVITQTEFGVCADIVFLERQEGESVQLSCEVKPGPSPPFGFSLRRSRLHSGRRVFYKYTKAEPSVTNASDKGRLSVSGDPSGHAVNISISQLSVADTDRYFCEFEVEKIGEKDEKIEGKTEFVLLVRADGLVDVKLVQTCSGGSAVLPCHTPNLEGLAVEGVSLKRQYGRAAVEVVYNSKHSVGRFPAGRVQLSSVPSSHGITYNVTLLDLQPEDSALYSCQLLLQGRPDRSTSLGGHAHFVSVQGETCSCFVSSTLPYILFAVVVVVLLIIIGFISKKSCRAQAQPPPPPIYEEMVGNKLAHLEEMESEYRNCSVRKAACGNHYESPSAALFPLTEPEK